MYQKTFGGHSPRHRLAGNNVAIKDETSNEVKKNGRVAGFTGEGTEGLARKTRQHKGDLVFGV